MQNIPSISNNKMKQDILVMGHERSQDSDGPLSNTNYTSNISQARTNVSPSKINRGVFSDTSGVGSNNVLSYLDEAESNMEQDPPQVMFDMSMKKQKGHAGAAGNGF